MNLNPSNYPPGVTGNEPEITGEPRHPKDPVFLACQLLREVEAKKTQVAEEQKSALYLSDQEWRLSGMKDILSWVSGRIKELFGEYVQETPELPGDVSDE